jgi:tRNA-splicing ligase RtcB
MNLPTPKKISELEYRIEPNLGYGMKIPVVIYANENLLQKMIFDRTIEQAINVSTLPGVLKHVVVLPDGHQGYGFPVGGVAGMDIDEGVISPGSVGYDINCGVRLIRTNLTENDIKPKLTELVDHLFNSIPSGLHPKEGCVQLTTSQLDEVLVNGVKWLEANGYATKDDLDVCEENGNIQNADPHKVSELAHHRGAPQVGSLGSGNHFLEIQRVQEIHDDEVAKTLGLFEGQITVLIHCGSRGLGHQVCTDYLKICEASHHKYGIELPDRQLACVPNISEEGISYKKAMNAAMNFAWSNRQMITHYARKSFESVLNQSESDLEMNLVYDIAHNSAKVEKHKIDGKEKSVLVHRKGATRAFPSGSSDIPKKYQNIGQPIFIPGSMGSASWILVGNQNSMNLTFGSTAHGAGRTMSRTQAHKNYNYKQIIEEIQAKGIVLKSMTRYGVVEEAPEVYKDVDVIASISHDLKIATKVARLVPLGVIKG